MKYPKALEDLIECFSKLPSVGRKSAERFALHCLMHLDEADVIDFSNAFIGINTDINICPECGNICEGDSCIICKDNSRNHRQILVVEGIKDLFTIEKINNYNGIYHVLNGAISFSKGITINDLNINSLVEKVKNNEADEIILATNATLEGETTARYIKELLNEYNVKITRIAHGLPVGGDLSYADEMTVLKAFEGRREY
ncbi:MAG: recombination protein RecR [Erysipelotrichaceae bacterium]|nr:recombination protein RecR [Erysipelotrichaceae bacterium]